MKEIILSLAHRAEHYMASLWNLEQSEVYGTYRFIDGKLNEVSHEILLGYTLEKVPGLARYSPAWLIQTETFIYNFLKEQTELGTSYRAINKWLITIHVDVLTECKPEDPLAPIISMQPYLQ